jgi:hypothetical protein
VQDLSGERVPFCVEFSAAAAAQYEIALPNSPDAMEPAHVRDEICATE